VGPEQRLQDLLGLKKRRAGTWALERAKEEFLRRHLRPETAIQSQAINPIYEGKDAILISATASGKTEAAMIPVAARIMSDHRRNLAVYLAPTRALLNDIHRRLKPSLFRLNLAARIRHGERRLPTDTREIDVLLTTPESLDVMLVQKTPLLKRTAFVIVDEIHQLLGGVRGSQIQFLLQRLELVVQHSIQRIALSATVGNPETLAEWICPGREPATVFTAPAQRTIVPTMRSISALDDFAEILRSQGVDKVLVFVNSRRTADDVFLALRRSLPHRVFVHYSNLTRAQREYVEAQFKGTDKGVCVATTTLELGIDIGSVEQVLLYDPPYTVSSFLQRVGRGGRRGDENYALMTPRSPLDLLQFISLVNLANSGRVENEVPGEPFSVLVQQIFSHICSKKNHRIHHKEIMDLCAPLEWIRPNEVMELLSTLVSRNFLRYDPKWDNYMMGPELIEAYNQAKVYSNIEEARGGFHIYRGGHLQATLPLPGNSVRLGSIILFAGRYWRISSISGRRLNVETSDPIMDPIRPMWGRRGLFSTSLTLARGMREALCSSPDSIQFNLDESCLHRIESIFGSVPTSSQPETIWHEQHPGHHIYYTFSGTIANLALQFLFQSAGHNCQIARNASGIAIVAISPLNFGIISHEPETFETLFQQHWRAFADVIQRGPYATLLPYTLSRREVMSHVMTGEVLEELTSLGSRTVVQANLGLVT
jgi:ATP-dependent Lhr-like helicase